MKKIALVLAVLLVVSGAAFAEVVVGGEATVAGEVSTTIGMDLESNVWGMDAGSSITLSIPLAAGSAGASGDDAAYGEIMLDGVVVNVFSDAFDGDNDGGTLSAKIVFGDMYVGLNWGGYNNNYAAGTADFDVNLSSDWYAVPAYGDLAFGFNNGMIGVELEVAAKNGLTRAAGATANEDFVGAWDGETAEAAATATTQDGVNGLVFSADLEYVSDVVTIPVYATIDPDWGGELLLGVSTDIAVAAGGLTIALPADFVMIGAANGFDVAPAVSYAISDAISVGADAYYYMHDTDTLMNAGVDFAGAFGDLTTDLAFDLSDLTGTLGWGVDLGLGYAVADGISVSVDTGYDSDSDFDVAAGLVFGAAATGIDNTVIAVDYANACFGTNADNGVISCSATVSF